MASLTVNAELAHRYTFDGSVSDAVGHMDCVASADALYTEAPTCVVASLDRATGPTRSMKVGEFIGSKESGVMINAPGPG